MIIKVLGSGCPTCKLMYERVLSLKKEGKIDAEVQYSDDINELVSLGAMASPAIAIDGKLAAIGLIGEDKVLELVKQFN